MKVHIPVKFRFPVVLLMGTVLLVSSVLLSSCTGQPVAAVPTAIAYAHATVAYLPPTVTSQPTAARPASSLPNSTPQSGPAPVGGVPQFSGQLILVSLSQQWLWAYQDRHLLYDTPITSGKPDLPTPDGSFYVHFHRENLTFISPWPVGSPNYYTPEHINYALYFLDDGYYIHDAPWRQTFGPGTNYPHTEPDGTAATGSHGCVNVPTSAGAWLYQWIQDGTAVVIYGTAPVPPQR